MDIQKYLSEFYKGTKNPTLDAMHFFMEEFDHPEKDLKVIHIAGTNGKGSCTEMMTNILIKAGYKVGKFLSPHLIKYNERISIQNQNITDLEIENLITEIKTKIDLYNESHNINVTLFELETTMAFLYFERNKCDFVVLETGLGGTYDCTNVANPIVSIISSIGYDHMHILGNTLVEIAQNKCGIIKNNSSTVFIKHEDKDVNDLVIKTCVEKNNDLHMIDTSDIKNVSYNEKAQYFDYNDYKQIEINLKGEKQINNASICLECINILKNKGYEIEEKAMREALNSVVHRGRFETISENPLIVFDGAHNAPAINNFINSVKMYYSGLKKTFVISILKTKDYKSVLNKLLNAYPDENFIFTDGIDTNRYVSKDNLYSEAKKILENNKCLYKKDLKESIRDLSKENEVAFVVGSFYVYGNVLEYLKKENYNE